MLNFVFSVIADVCSKIYITLQNSKQLNSLKSFQRFYVRCASDVCVFSGIDQLMMWFIV